MEISKAEFPLYISGEEICCKYQLVPSQLLELVRQGMTPVYPLRGIPLVCLTGKQPSGLSAFPLYWVQPLWC